MKHYVLVNNGESEATASTIWAQAAAQLFPAESVHASKVWMLIFESLRDACAFIEYVSADAHPHEVTESEGWDLFMDFADQIEKAGGGIVWAEPTHGYSASEAEVLGQVLANDLRAFMDTSDADPEVA